MKLILLIMKNNDNHHHHIDNFPFEDPSEPSLAGQQTGNQIGGIQGCICLPVNQRCPYDGGSGSTTGAGVFDVRIVNRVRP